MTLKTPRFRKAGFASDEEYKAAKAATLKTQKAALLATSVRGNKLLVLKAMWVRADWHRPVCTVTKEQLMADTGACLDTVKKALKALREEGSVKPMKNWQGGRRVPTTWQLRIAGRTETPSEQQTREQIMQRDHDATWRCLKGKFGAVRALEILDECKQ